MDLAVSKLNAATLDDKKRIVIVNAWPIRSGLNEGAWCNKTFDFWWFLRLGTLRVKPSHAAAVTHRVATPPFCYHDRHLYFVGNDYASLA
ncbi:hypothetical protein [Yersinia ruckeri]|uniref:hypothetical protein n=1 Tax=Yersinia ruckeri TaxID=29486 RepID=UPI0005373925|nr:hypothetical protein [Yersinia ruckeri]